MRLGVLGMLLQTSAILYENYVPYAKIRAVLGALALLNFVSFEKSLKREGARIGRPAAAAAIKSLGLSVFAGIAAPVIETLLIDRLHLWSYPVREREREVGALARFCLTAALAIRQSPLPSSSALTRSPSGHHQGSPAGSRSATFFTTLFSSRWRRGCRTSRTAGGTTTTMEAAGNAHRRQSRRDRDRGDRASDAGRGGG